MGSWGVFFRAGSCGKLEKPRRAVTSYARNVLSVFLLVLFFVVVVVVVDSVGHRKVVGLRSREPKAMRTGRILHSVETKVFSNSQHVEAPSRSKLETRKAGALHGMGELFRKGSRAMNELIVAHLADATSVGELRMFLRTLHRSGATARADLVLLFPWSSVPEDITDVVAEEEQSFRKLVKVVQAKTVSHSKRRHGKQKIELTTEKSENLPTNNEGFDQAMPTNYAQEKNRPISIFTADAFWKSAEDSKGKGELLWENSTAHTLEAGDMANVSWGHWGSIVGFEMQELDTNDVLKGFLEAPPAQLRRWFCYQMLLGMVKQKYRSVLLTEVDGVLILGDVLSAVRKKSSGLYLPTEDHTWAAAQALQIEANKALDFSAGEPVGNPPVQQQKEKRKAPSWENEGDEKTPEMDSEDEEFAERYSKETAQSPPTQPDNLNSRKSTGKHYDGFIEDVYGKKLWKSFEKEDKIRATLNSALLLGTMRPIRSLANAMATEIVRVALDRKNREPFHDKAVLNYLVYKSSVLSKKITEKMHKVANRDSLVHVLPASKQQKVFTKDTGAQFAALQGLRDASVGLEKASVIVDTIHNDICSSDATIYRDCASTTG